MNEIKHSCSAKENDVVISEGTVLKSCKAISARKRCGPDGECGRVLIHCAKEPCVIIRVRPPQTCVKFLLHGKQLPTFLFLNNQILDMENGYQHSCS